MKILYIYREKEKQEHSIEAVFDTVARSLEDLGHDIYKWYKPVSWRKTIRDIWRLRLDKYDVYHITGDVNYLWVLFPWRKTTMTCHDIGMYKNNPKTIKRRLYVWVSFILSSCFLKKITAVSYLTKDDLVHYLDIRNTKIEVIPNPLSLPITKSPRAFNKKCPTILQIGSGWHKNLEGLLESIKGIRCHIDIIGNPDVADRDRLKKYNINYTVSYRIPMDEVIKKYKECDILYFISRSEGFGMPIIEAQTIGRVVLTTNEEPTKTIAGGAALLFEPEDHQAIHEGILRIINDDELREQLILKGYENAAQYDPKIICLRYEQFYKDTFGLK